MNLYFENETPKKFDFDLETSAKMIINKALEIHNCPYDWSLSLYIVNNNDIKEINNNTRNINNPTDVLSFPNINFESIGDFTILEDCENSFDYFDPDSGELILGEIVISYEKVIEQANNYGHSEYREISFLIAHSILHLLGYDHMIDSERIVMEDMQNRILNELKIFRD